MPLNAKLVVVGGDVKTPEIKLRLPSTIGRGKGTNIILQHPLVSRQHCELYESAGQLMVRDLGSLNGTFVNNQRVTESPLPAGELLTVGTVTFRAVYEAEEAGAAPAKSKLDATTVDAKQRAKRPAPPPDDDAPLEFDFGKPLLPGDDELAAEHPTEQLEATLEETPKPTKDKTRGSAPPKPAPKQAPQAASKPANKPEDATVHVSQWDEDKEEADADSEDDDDLNDFLKNLGEK
jgi:hypothetical protein